MMGARETDRFREQWQLDDKALHWRMTLAPSPGSGPFGKLRMASDFGERGSAALIFGQAGSFHGIGKMQRTELRSAVLELPTAGDIVLANWVRWQVEQKGNIKSGTLVALSERLRRRHGGRLNVVWDNTSAHSGEAVQRLNVAITFRSSP